MRFRTKPFEIEAILFTGDNIGEVKGFTGIDKFDTVYKIPEIESAIVAEVYDELHDTWVGVKAGQWIIRGQKGEYYPCDPEIFEAKYEAVDE